MRLGKPREVDPNEERNTQKGQLETVWDIHLDTMHHTWALARPPQSPRPSLTNTHKKSHVVFAAAHAAALPFPPALSVVARRVDRVRARLERQVLIVGWDAPAPCPSLPVVPRNPVRPCGSGHLAAVELTTGIDPHRSPS